MRWANNEVFVYDKEQDRMCRLHEKGNVTRTDIAPRQEKNSGRIIVERKLYEKNMVVKLKGNIFTFICINSTNYRRRN